MEDPTIEFDLITFQDLSGAPYSGAPISRSVLRDRILFAKTNQGNLCKFQVHSGDNLLIVRLTLYNAQGCIVKIVRDLVIHSGHGCNLDAAAETSAGADFEWGVSAGSYHLNPQNGASFHLYVDYDEITLEQIQSAVYQPQRVERLALLDQVVLCRTGQERYAKLLLQSAGNLRVRRLTVYGSNGQVEIDKSNITVPQNSSLKVESGQVVPSGGDLWWQAQTATQFYLTPQNGAAISYPSYFAFDKYLPLVRSAAIRSALVFADASGVHPYAKWTAERKTHLNEFLYMRETGQTLPIAGPPDIGVNLCMSECDAWKIYLAHVAQSFWIDAHGVVSWKLSAAGAEHLVQLFDMRKLMLFTPGQGHSFSGDVMGAVTDWNPVFSWYFMDKEAMIKADQWGTIQALTDWCRANLHHIASYTSPVYGGPFASANDQIIYQYGYLGEPPVDKMIDPIPGRYHITEGCWGTDGFLAAVLRSVNIPVRHGRSHFWNGTHSRPEFFTVGKNLAHGDDPYTAWTALGPANVPNVPIARIFYDNAALHASIDNPVPLVGKTVAETASYNDDTFKIALAVEYKTNYLLDLRCIDVAANNTGTNRQVWQQLHEHYSDAQIAQIEIDCDAVIASVNGGCDTVVLG